MIGAASVVFSINCVYFDSSLNNNWNFENTATNPKLSWTIKLIIYSLELGGAGGVVII